MPDWFNNPHLVVGTRLGNYLVTVSRGGSGFNVGPARCEAYKVSEHTRLLISTKRQDESLIDGTVLGLAQVRTAFENPVTYTTRRATVEGFDDLSKMSVTLFTLHNWSISGTKVFHQLYIRSLEKNPQGVILKITDIDEPDIGGARIGECNAKLSELFINGELNVSNSTEADGILQDMANILSKAISDKNRTLLREP
ncbi:hypothetical protein BX616_010843 [Lobosporangium transversale]|nr:hypothetical protein BX616_010843 [Lobosporangium transversale]